MNSNQHPSNPLHLKNLKRKGMTLLEVMLALFILVVSISAISGLVNLGLQSSADARTQSIAQILCESKMGEISSGVLEPVATTGSFENQPDWTFEVQTDSTDTPGLLSVRVIVKRAAQNNQFPEEFHLVRLKVDPNFDAETAE